MKSELENSQNHIFVDLLGIARINLQLLDCGRCIAAFNFCDTLGYVSHCGLLNYTHPKRSMRRN